MIQIGQNMTKGLELGLRTPSYPGLVAAPMQAVAVQAARAPSYPSSPAMPGREPAVRFGDVYVRNETDIEILAYRVAQRLREAQR